MNKKVFSIIIPSYNCENLIEQTLKSVIQQDNSLYECIVVDGLSEDNTINILKQYSNLYENIRYISEKDNGIYDAMNKGIDLARGQYLYFIGAGDRLFDDVLKRINANINSEDIIYGNTYMEFEKKMQGRRVKKSDLIYEMLCHQGIFYNRNVFDLIGKYEEKYRVVADNILNKKIFANDTLVKKYVDIDIANYLGGGVSQQINIVSEFNTEDEYVNELIKIFGEEYFGDLYKYCKNIDGKRIIAWGNGGEFKKANSYKSVKINYFVKSNIKEKEIFEGKDVLSKEELLNENKDNIFIFVYSAYYYVEIREWLENNQFEEFKNFMLVTKEILMILNKLNIY